MEIKDSKDAAAYQVIMQDEYDNLYLLGLYASLEDARKDVNDWLAAYDEDGVEYLEEGELSEYASTFGSCFDREVEWKGEDGGPGCVMIRGFALSAKSLKEDAERILRAANKEETK